MLVVRGSIVCIVGLIISLQGVLPVQLQYSIKNEHWLEEVRWGFTIELDLPQKQCNLDVQLSRNLTVKNFVEITDNVEGKVIQRASEEDNETCHYIGKIPDVPDSWVALSVCDDIEGIIYDGLGIYSINNRTLRSTYGKTEMALVDGEGNIEIDFACGGGDNNKYVPDIETNETCRFKRVDLSESSKYFIEMALVIDRSVSNDFWRRGRLIQNHYKDIINVVNAFCQKFQLFVSVVIFDHHVHRSYGSDLDGFAGYASDLLKREHVDHVQLLTTSMITIQQKDGSSSLVKAAAKFGGMCHNESYSMIKDSWNLQRTASLISLQIARSLGVSSYEIEDECFFSSRQSNCSFEPIEEMLQSNSSFLCLRNKPIANALIDDSNQSELVTILSSESHLLILSFLGIILLLSCLFTDCWKKMWLSTGCNARIAPMGGLAPPANVPPQVAVNHIDQHPPRHWQRLRNYLVNEYLRRND